MSRVGWMTALAAAAVLAAGGAQAQDMLTALSLNMGVPRAPDTAATAPVTAAPAAANPAPQAPTPIPPIHTAAAVIPVASPEKAAPTPAPVQAPTPAAAEPAKPATPPTTLSAAQLDQLVAPVALYPDPLLSQVLMASTYPLEVVEAARWVSIPANRALQGDALMKAVKSQKWDASIVALLPFPRLLQTMSDKLQWTQDLGNAFLAQQAEVMAAVQRLRHEAMAAGNLKETPECHCVIKSAGENISILPSEPKTVCVPVYNPVVAYGPWPYPYYPPYAFPPPPAFVYPPGVVVAFYPVVEVAYFEPLWGWGWIDWGHGYIAVDRARFAVFAGGHIAFAGSVWVHDPVHRGAVGYVDPAVTARFGHARAAAVAARFASAATVGAAARFATGRTGGAVAFRHHGPHGGGPHGFAALRNGTVVRGPGGFHGGFHGGPHGGFPGGFHGGPAHFAAIGGGHGGGWHGGGHGGGHEHH